MDDLVRDVIVTNRITEQEESCSVHPKGCLWADSSQTKCGLLLATYEAMEKLGFSSGETPTRNLEVNCRGRR